MIEKPEKLLKYLRDVNIQSAIFCPNIITRSVSATADSKNFTVDDGAVMKHSRSCAEVWDALRPNQTKTSHVF